MERAAVDDEKIKELFRQHSEDAVRKTQEKYGKYLLSVAQRILGDEQDSIECVNDVLLAAWKTLPSADPQDIKTFLGKIVRNLALDRWRAMSAEKRGGGRVAEALDELAELASPGSPVEDLIDSMTLSDTIRAFLRGLKTNERVVFMKRYWHFLTDAEIAEETGLSRSNVRVILHRCRKKLKEELKKEGFEI